MGSLTGLSIEELEEISRLIAEARARGDEEEASRLIMSRIPLPPHSAALLKQMWGAEELKSSGFNLNAAEAKYGKDWLNK